MMREIQENGPIVCSFSPDYTFSLYKSGIYDSIGVKTWKNLGLSKPQWEKVDHSVLCIGWGKLKKIYFMLLNNILGYDEIIKKKYWLVRNSWGKSWGKEGDFKIWIG